MTAPRSRAAGAVTLPSPLRRSEPPRRRRGRWSGRGRPRVLRGASLLLQAGALLAALAPTAAQAQNVTLISNDGQSGAAFNRAVGTSGTFQFTQAQQFTTGANTGGYTLSAVDGTTTTAPAGVTPTVSICNSSSGSPGSTCTTLTNPASFAVGKLTWTAPAGTTLAANTDYFVVFEGSGGQYNLSATSSDGQDAGGAEGWSIADVSRWRNSDGGNFSNNPNSLRITIKGAAVTATDNTAPTLAAMNPAVVDGATLTLTYSEALDTNSVPASSAFSVTVAGSTRALANTSPVAISGSAVTLTLASAVTAGQTVTVSYAVPTNNPIQDAAGNDADALTNQAVTNNTAPGISGVADATVAENVAWTSGTPTFHGAEGTVTWTLGGTDAADFAIVSATGVVSMAARDFENPADANTNNVYEASVTATDSATPTANTATAAFQVTVTDVAVPAKAAAPTVAATSGSSTSLDVSWTAVTGATSYDLQYREGTAGNWTNGPQNVTGTSSAIASLMAGTSYQVQVRAGNAEGGVWSDAATGMTAAATVPYVPRTFRASPGSGGRIAFTWAAPQAGGQTGYEIRHSTSASFPAGSTTTISNIAASATRQNVRLNNDRTYHAQIRAKDSGGTFGPWSYTLEATPGGVEVRHPPSNPGQPMLTAGDRQLTVTWRAAQSLGSTVTTYDVRYRREGTTGYTEPSGAEWEIGRDTTLSWTITGLTNGTTYEVSVRATNAIGNSGWSIRQLGTPVAAVADNTPPALAATNPATVNGTALVLTYDEPLDTNSVPASSAFSVTVAGSTRALANTSPVAISGSAVTLTLASAVTAGQTVTVSYTAPATNPIKDAADNNAGNLSNQAVTNNTADSATGVVLSVSPTSVSEGASATTVTVTATLSGGTRGSATPVTVTVGATGDGATEGTDYATVSDDVSISIAAGATAGTGTFTLTPTQDTDVEGGETISLDGSTTVSGLTVTDTTLTLADDDTANTAPAFASDTATRSFAENTAAGTNIGVAVTATDADNDDLTYSLGGTDAASFQIVAGTGQLQTKSGVTYDFETKSSYSVTVTASDGNGGSDSIGVTITLTDVVETSTLNITGLANATVNENATFTSATPSVSGAIGAVTWTLEGTDAADFTIAAATGVVSMVGRDFENPADSDTNNVYAVTVKATDSDGNSDTHAFTVTVADVVETATLEITGLANATVNENATFTSATPGVSGAIGDVTWTLEGTDAADFTINAGTGVVSMVGRDFENPADADTNNVYAVTVKATDSDGNSDTHAFTVTVSNVVETSTLAISGLANATVNENEAFTSATPSVSGAIGAVAWTLEGTDAADFTIAAATGVVSMIARDFENPADANTDNVYAVTVKATDADGNSDTHAFTVRVNDVGETATLAISGLANATVNENAAFTSATPSVSGAIGAVTWTLEGTDATDFTIAAATGVVSMIARDFENPADADTNNVYAVTVRVTDADANTATHDFTVTVNDVTETSTLAIAGLADVTVNENAAFTSATPSVSGAIGAVTWTLEGTDAADFTIAAATGVVSMIARDFENPADADTNNVYAVTVKATDSDGNSDTHDFTVTVNDVVETATLTIAGLADATVNENATFTSATPSVSGAIGAVTWTLEGTDAADFTIAASTGVVSMVGRDFENPADADTNNIYAVTVKATDSDGNSDTHAFTVTVNDVVETATLAISGLADATVNENEVFTSATPSVSGAIGAVTWTLEGADAADLTIAASTGVVSMVGRDFENPADADTNNIYAVTVKATDADGNSDTHAFTVTVANVAETSTLAITGLANATVNENATFTSATPSVSGAIGAVTWTLEGTDAADFTIAATTGVVSMVGRDFENPADDDTNNVYAVTVRATDTDGNTDIHAFTVTVNDVVESATLTITGLADATVNENEVFTSATPSVSGAIGAVTWTLEGADAADFTIVATTGVVSMVGRDFENPADTDANNVYDVTVKATDADGNTDIHEFTVTVDDVTETATLAITGLADATVNENEVFTSATPTVSGAIGAVTWTLEGADAAHFTIAASTGVVSMIARDFENPADDDTNNVYAVTVRATDTDGNTAIHAFTVTVNDVAETSTLAIAGLADVTVNENAAFTSATPSVSGAIGAVTWALEGADAADFTIAATTGVVSMVGRDYENPADADTNNVYAVTVRATDTDGNTDTHAFTVTVADVVESATLTISGLADATVNENEVFTSATPSVSGAIGDVTWTLEGADAADFTIAAATGVVSMVGRDFENPADTDANNVYDVTVKATDADGNTDIHEFTVTVNDVAETGTPPPPGTATPPPPGNRAPTAAAGADRTVDPGASVTLSGSGTDPDGDTLTFAWAQTGDTPRVALAGANAATATFTAPVEPATLTFTLTVSDGRGGSATDAVTVTVSDLAPGFGGAAVAALALTAGEAIEPLVLPEARGGNGALTYALASQPAGLAGLSFDPATRTLSGTPSAGGGHVFTYRADDADANLADSDAAVLTFQVTVATVLGPAGEAVRQVLRQTLAAVGVRTLTSALGNIGARFADGGPGTMLTLAGQTVSPGAGVAPSGGRDAACAAGGVDGFGRAGFGGTGAGAGHTACGNASSWGVESDELFGSSAFTLRLGAEPDGTGADPTAVQWALWGRGDLGDFEGRPEAGSRYEGETRTAWLGFDGRAGPWVAGVALSHGESEADYAFDTGDGVAGSGRLETVVTAVYPYGRWTLADGLELRGVLGAGTGEARHVPEGGAAETTDLSMRMASLGLRQELPALGGVDLATRADASLVRMEMGDGPDTISGVSADNWRGRVGLEASRRLALDGDAALVPFVEVAGRRDGGDGLTGTGLEVAEGVRYTAPGVEVEARGRWLAAHTEEGARERGVSVTARVGPGAQGRGLSLSLSPRWGAGTGAAEALWRDEMPRHAAGGAEGGGLDARIGYGVLLTPEGVLTPFAETGLAGDENRHLRIGIRFDAAHGDLGLELAGERSEGGAAEAEHALKLDLRLRF